MHPLPMDSLAFLGLTQKKTPGVCPALLLLSVSTASSRLHEARRGAKNGVRVSLCHNRPGAPARKIRGPRGGSHTDAIGGNELAARGKAP